MTPLQNLEVRICTLHTAVSLRPTLERAVEIGNLLAEVKQLLPHGEFQPWCRRLPFSGRTARGYLQAAKWQQTAILPESVTIDQFLRIAKTRTRPDPPTGDAPAVADCRVVTADCRRFDWPHDIALAATDPPWAEDWAYDWLAEFAAKNLRDDALALVQCGVGDLPDRVRRLSRHLTYRWTLSIVYESSRSTRPYAGMVPNWRPVIVMVKGKMKGVKPVSDVMTVAHAKKTLHPWQQPAWPWYKWLSAWTGPGDLIADPFAGSGSVGVAVRAIGGRTYLGTEVDPDHARTARLRITKVTTGWADDYEG